MSRRTGTRIRRNESRTLVYMRLARPHFLAGGFLLYGLGAAIARYEGITIDGGLYLAGQAVVTCVQLMTHFLNEYWDVESDRPNPNRTWFSGGSGVLPAGLVDRDTAYTLGIICLVGAFVAAFTLAVTLRVTLVSWLIVAAAVSGAWFYSAPPVRLAATGFGEWTTSLMVAGLLPAFAYSLQTGHLSPLVGLAAAPLFMLHVAMLVSFELPDAATDEETGKRTLYVRLGARRAVLLHRALLAAAYVLLGLGALAGAPALVVLSGALTFPLALVLGLAFPWLAQGAQEGRLMPGNYNSLTLGGVSLFAVTAALMTLGYWWIG